MDGELRVAQAADGAVFDAAAPGGGPPLRFAGVEAEWAAVREACGVVDAGIRAVLRAGGSDRESFLQGMLTNDVVRLDVGGGVPAALLTIQGRIVADLRVYKLADEMWLEMPAARLEAVRAALDRHLVADDVELVADDAVAALVSLEGPGAGEVARRVVDGAGGLPAAPLAHGPATVGGAPVRVAAASLSGAGGYLFLGPAGLAAVLWSRCRVAGAVPVGLEALDVLRLEAGIPWYGRDMSEDVLISEVGLEEAISTRKGCYLGQEVVERVAARGQVQRRLVGLRCEGAKVPATPADLAADGRVVGMMTSAAWSPACAAVIGLGYVRRDWWAPGTELRLAAEPDRVVRVASLPFVGGTGGSRS